MNPNTDPQPESTVEPQKPLLEILDEIEAKEKRKQEVQPPGRICGCNDCASSREKVALVKALRRAMQSLEWALMDDAGLMEHRISEVAAILNQERK